MACISLWFGVNIRMVFEYFLNVLDFFWFAFVAKFCELNFLTHNQASEIEKKKFLIQKIFAKASPAGFCVFIVNISEVGCGCVLGWESV